jgi:hypothetical protein
VNYFTHAEKFARNDMRRLVVEAVGRVGAKGSARVSALCGRDAKPSGVPKQLIRVVRSYRFFTVFRRRRKAEYFGNTSPISKVRGAASAPSAKFRTRGNVAQSALPTHPPGIGRQPRHKQDRSQWDTRT